MGYAQYEIWSGNRYLFTCGWDEDPRDAVKGIDNARVIQVRNGERREVY